ncbi:hypothetical protein PMI01_01381 [Caulobacter sp. AP07]|uniref:hypothetical protein n=1 Tax=Caulobacter sp. AP07 TaxID=1144304 RepID=UPI000272013D|nr:hypothetical protein [Caulobacter sp. AP07]EJL34688.1 hypothetical protein PMI01_01381 [Caulobacter sp. AP07]
MTSLRVISPDVENWAPRRREPSPARPPLPILSLSIAVLLGLYGMQLMLSEARDVSPAVPSVREPERFEPDPPPTSAQRLKIVLTPSAAITTHPETWAVLPTALDGPVVATPLADPRTATQQAAACREAHGMATQMVCVDPMLAAADRQASDAYEAVLAAGASQAALGRSQARWMLVREAAARSSPEDLLAAYQERIRRLRATATALLLQDEALTNPPPESEPIVRPSASPVKAAITPPSAGPVKAAIARRPARLVKETIVRRPAGPAKETIVRRPTRPAKEVIARRPAEEKMGVRGSRSPRSPSATPPPRKKASGVSSPAPSPAPRRPHRPH